MSNNKSENTYTDLEGREFHSLPKLCAANGIIYSRCYNLYHKGTPLEECIKDGFKYIGKNIKSTTNNPNIIKYSDFIPKSNCPGREYIDWLKFEIKKETQLLNDEIGMNAVHKYELIQQHQKTLDNIEQYWLGVLDAIVTNNESLLSTFSDKAVNDARLSFNIAMKERKGLYWDIYGRFAEHYKPLLPGIYGLNTSTTHHLA